MRHGREETRMVVGDIIRLYSSGNDDRFDGIDRVIDRLDDGGDVIGSR